MDYFTRLPTEIRYEIYKLCLICNAPIIPYETPRRDSFGVRTGEYPRRNRKTVQPQQPKGLQQELGLGLLRASSLIGAEAATMFYADNIFIFSVWLLQHEELYLTKAFPSLWSYNKHRIKHVQLYVIAGEYLLRKFWLPHVNSVFKHRSERFIYERAEGGCEKFLHEKMQQWANEIRSFQSAGLRSIEIDFTDRCGRSGAFTCPASLLIAFTRNLQATWIEQAGGSSGHGSQFDHPHPPHTSYYSKTFDLERSEKQRLSVRRVQGPSLEATNINLSAHIPDGDLCDCCVNVAWNVWQKAIIFYSSPHYVSYMDFVLNGGLSNTVEEQKTHQEKGRKGRDRHSKTNTKAKRKQKSGCEWPETLNPTVMMF